MKKHRISLFFRTSCIETKDSRNHQTKNGITRVSILGSPVGTTVFWWAVLEIIAIQNTNSRCVRRVMKKKKKKKKKEKLDGTRVELVCEMRCEAASNADYREIEISYETSSPVYDWIRNVLLGKVFLVCWIQFSFSINIARNVKCQSVSRNWKSRHYDIHFTRTLPVDIKSFLKNSINWPF